MDCKLLHIVYTKRNFKLNFGQVDAKPPSTIFAFTSPLQLDIFSSLLAHALHTIPTHLPDYAEGGGGGT
jgi:hypothetical protein